MTGGLILLIIFANLIGMKQFIFPEQIMQQLGVAGVFLFGSQATGTATAVSDFDFGILLTNPNDLYDYRLKQRIYSGIYDLLSNQIQRLCDIDIVFLQIADLQLQFHVVNTGQLLYAGNQHIVSNFLERTIDHYADFAPLRHEFHQAILARI